MSSFIDRTLDKILSIRRDIQLKAIAIVFFGVIAFIMCYPLLRNPEAEISTQHVTVISLCIFGIIITVLSDRIASFTISKDKLDVTLTQVKEYMGKQIEDARADLASQALSLPQSSSEEYNELNSKLSEVEALVKKESKKDSPEELIQTARDIGNLLGMFEEIEKRRKQIKSQASKKD